MRDIQPIVERLSQVRANLLAVAESIPPERWQKRPAPGKWSAAEVIAHLTMVEKAVVDGAEKLFRSEPRPVPLWERLHVPIKLAEWRFLRARTPLPLDAGFVGEKDTMLERFAATRRRALEFLESHCRRDLSRWRWRHPFFGRLDGYQWFEMLYHHEIRHTKQLREIVKSMCESHRG